MSTRDEIAALIREAQRITREETVSLIARVIAECKKRHMVGIPFDLAEQLKDGIANFPLFGDEKKRPDA